MHRLPILSAIALAAGLAVLPAMAQTSAPAPAPAQSADPLIATVNGQPIHFSDVQAAAQTLPSQMQQLPPQQLFPLLVNQLIDRQALLAAAKAESLQNNPQVASAMQDAADEKLENAYVQQKVGPQVTDAAIAAAYKAQYAGKPGPEQVDARHILVKTQAEAQAIIVQLNHGADFAKLAEKDSIDPGAANGGELGWFTQDQMVPTFANAAFALKPGQYTKTPVQTQFGWHVILCEGKRTQPTPSLADVKDQISQALADQAVKATLADARSHVTIKLFNANGSGAGGDSSDGSSDGGGETINLNPGNQ
jgi:peptidyl-prolyl cis-trans isomerase C